MNFKYPQAENFTFLGLKKLSLKNSAAVILPVPYEASTTYKSNTKEGPQAIIEASRHLEFYDLELKKEIPRIGIYTAPYLEPDTRGPDKMILRIYTAVLEILKLKKFPVVLGGEHTVALGAIKAVSEFYKDFSVLQLDAHADLRQTYQGSPFNHACVMRRVLEITEKIVSVGIRSFSQEEAIFIQKNFSSFYRTFETAKKGLPDTEILKGLGKNVYITLDLDVFDPSLMPAVGTPEPGGLFWPEVLGLLKQVALKKNIVGLDVVELAPIPGLIHPDFLAAKLIYKLLGYKHFLK